MKTNIGVIIANRYKLIKLLGKGAYSEVWYAEDTIASNMPVALKIYATSGGLNEEGQKIFSKEYQLLFDLNHPNLLKPMHFDIWEDSPYLVLPYCSKGSVANKIGKFNEQDLIVFLNDISAGLEYLHKNGFIHQDIKPANILIDNNGRYVITDFGISTNIRSTLRRSLGQATSGGTLAYMAPERFSKTPTPIMSNDIFSLGATAYELASGHVPFGENGGLNLKAGAEIPNLPPQFSKEANDLVMQCMNLEPWDRPTAEKIHQKTKEMLQSENEPVKENTEQVHIHRKTAAFNQASENYAEAEIPSKEMIQQEVKPPKKMGRNWFIPTYLWIVILVNFVLAIFNFFPDRAFGYYALEVSPLVVYYISGICNLLFVASAILLLFRLRPGFWIMCCCVAIVLLTQAINGSFTLYGFAVSVISILILFAILQIKKHGSSYWSQLRLPIKADQRTLTFLPICVIVLAIVLIGINSALPPKYVPEDNFSLYSVPNLSEIESVVEVNAIDVDTVITTPVVAEAKKEVTTPTTTTPKTSTTPQATAQSSSSSSENSSSASTPKPAEKPKLETHAVRAADNSCRLHFPKKDTYSQLDIGVPNAILTYGNADVGPIWVVLRDGDAESINKIQGMFEDEIEALMQMALDALSSFTIISKGKLSSGNYPGYQIIYDALIDGQLFRYQVFKFKGENGYYDIVSWALKPVFQEKSKEIANTIMTFKEL